MINIHNLQLVKIKTKNQFQIFVLQNNTKNNYRVVKINHKAYFNDYFSSLTNPPPK